MGSGANYCSDKAALTHNKIHIFTPTNGAPIHPRKGIYCQKVADENIDNNQTIKFIFTITPTKTIIYDINNIKMLWT